MTVIIRRVLIGSAFPAPDFDDATPYLAAYDPDFVAPGVDYPTGLAYWTADPDQAMRFDSIPDALHLWQTQSTTRPWRADGKPNRPLTAISITMDTVP